MTEEHTVTYGGYRCGECGRRIVLRHTPSEEDSSRAVWVHEDRPEEKP